MKFTPTSIPDVVVVEPQVFGDARGFFMETYHAGKFAAAGIEDVFVQDNHSSSAQHILRGLHYQYQQAQGKLVRVVHGEIFDVAVDLRRSAATFGQWVGLRLSAENKRQLWVPPGFAHGFLVLSERAEVVYKATALYAPQWEATLMWNDPQVGIDWPLPAGQLPVLAEKDKNGRSLRDTPTFA